MKRNRLNPSSKQANIFSNSTSRLGKRSHLLALSLLSITGIFITSIVLATSEPATTSLQSNIIDLPNLPAEMQLTPNNLLVTEQKEISLQALPEVSDTKPQVEEASIAEETPLENEALHTIELAAVEQQVISDSIISSQAENKTLQATEKTQSADNDEVISSADKALNWKEITVKSGDNLSLIFPRVGLTARDTYNVAQLGKDVKPLLNLKPGQVLRFGFSDSQDPKTFQQLDLELSPISTLEVKVTATGYDAELLTRDVETRQAHASGTIESSLFGAGIAANLSDSVVMELAYIFGWDIDFALDLREGDHFTLIYNEEYLDDTKIGDGDILAAEFTNNGKTYRAIRYTDDKGSSHYYTPTGDSMRKAFNRTPVHFSRISSKFNPNRKHPILKTTRPHQGVDYAAATGTPIMATGDGKVNFVGTKGGYGRTVILSHGGKYTTLYAHMSKFKKGIKSGMRVKQGDVIGYIGMSGTATGPHLHYEFRINGVHRNPLTVALPKAEALPKKYRNDFAQKSQHLLAQLDSLSETRLAMNTKQ